jgi:NAD(P)-dependent dehydrogenase (short-subunit alcohol dehydrogenase family)
VLAVPESYQHVPMRPRLEGRTALVTGASSGVGRAIARALAREGASVALVARNPGALENGAEEVRAAGAKALVLPLDVSDAHAVDEAAQAVVDSWGRLDIWVNDAMVSVFAPSDRITPEEYRRVTEVNYLGYVHGTLAALRHMRAQDSGVIVQVSSALAYRSIPLQSAYCASKAAIRGFTDSVRTELIHDGSRVRITMLALPAVNTPQFEVVRNKLGKHPQPVPPIYQPEVIADIAIDAIVRPRREVWIGTAGKAILGQRVIPGLLDHYLARVGYRGQITEDLPPGHAPLHTRDNVDQFIPGDRGAHGIFDDRARRSAGHWQRPLLAMAALLVLAGLVLPGRHA